MSNAEVKPIDCRTNTHCSSCNGKIPVEDLVNAVFFTTICVSEHVCL